MPGRSTPRSATPTGSSKLACRLRSGASATATTTPWPRPSTACTRPSSCSGKDRGREPTTSSSRPWAGSTGSTTPGCTPPSTTGPQPRLNPSTTVRSTPPSTCSWENPPCSEPGAIHTVPWVDPGPPQVTVTDADRWAGVEHLLHDDTLRSYTRLGGLFTLLFAQPLSRIVAMRSDQVTTTGAAV